ncbi:NAD(P)-dependent oxidoreductase [Aphelenchoides fujianensis]|nr:NAD(P)-dependent oxidoreductase [Aphelenchoides fujianensis]
MATSPIRNTGYFKGATVFISGASRGIGLAIAKKLAKDGANIVIAAKTAEAHPKLPGTIYTAAKEIEAEGGRALPLVVDVRDEQSAKKAVDEAVQKFGGIDVLINNASAISQSPTVDTEMKRYDLMHSVNGRGTFLLSKLCIPHLKKSRKAAILNISPPLDMAARWFAPHPAYTASKFLMSIYALGMAEELKADGIAVNCLWPRGVIWTAAVENVLSKGHDVQKFCRKPEIMADAAYLILSNKQTGQFLIDDTFLAEKGGVRNFDYYAYDPSAPLRMDFFVPDYIPDPCPNKAKL